MHVLDCIYRFLENHRRYNGLFSETIFAWKLYFFPSRTEKVPLPKNMGLVSDYCLPLGRPYKPFYGVIGPFKEKGEVCFQEFRQ